MTEQLGIFEQNLLPGELVVLKEVMGYTRQKPISVHLLTERTGICSLVYPFSCSSRTVDFTCSWSNCSSIASRTSSSGFLSARFTASLLLAYLGIWKQRSKAQTYSLCSSSSTSGNISVPVTP